MRAVAAGSLLLYLAERAAECAVITHYFLSAQFLWAGWTLGLLLPGCLIQALSFVWYRTDGHPQCFTLTLAHFLQLGILKRHVDCLWSPVRRRDHGECEAQQLVMKQGDLLLLRLMETLLQALPHLLLQTYIYLTADHADIYAACSALLCLLSVSWALVSFSHFLCLLRPGHLCLPWASVLCQLLWRMGMIGTRVMALVVFTRVYHVWVFAVGGAHWLVMSFWLVAQQTDVIARPCYWRLFNILLGAVYVFCFINVRDGPSRYRIAIFYVIMLLENCILLLLATDFLQEAVWSNVRLSVAVMSGFLIGCAALIIYYTLLHPKSTEITQSFKTGGAARGKGNESSISSRWWHRMSNKEVDDLFRRQDLNPKSREQETLPENEDLAWMKVATNHHHLLLLKLAMKTGNRSKINAAFGDGGPRDLFYLGGTPNAQQPLMKTNVVSVQNKSVPPNGIYLKSEPWFLGQMQGDTDPGHKCGPQESSTYVTLGNSTSGEGASEKGDKLAADGRTCSSAKVSGVATAGSPSNGMLGSATLYFSAHTDGMVLSEKDADCLVAAPETGLKASVDSSLKETPENKAVEAKELPVMCVSPILSLAANSNFQRSIAEDVISLCEESDMSTDETGILEAGEPSGKSRYHLLTAGSLPPSVTGRLIKEEKPCFTSTPKPQATSVDLGPREETKARRRLDQATETT
ncbi:XK-related protein 5 [Pseudophryne corroboree]|uniref:XK-related protein 5 n=1 Tax=Pseudophryne corroboree TaxID=495146 RepID=UPI00308191B8